MLSKAMGDGWSTRSTWTAWATPAPGEVAKRAALQRLGDPYTDEQIAQAAAEVEGKTELDAVVAYLQALGRHAPRGGQP